MQYIALIIAIVGTGLLFLVLFEPPRIVSSLDEVLSNERVKIEGEVSSERIFGDVSYLSVQNITVVCSCKRSYLGSRVEIMGVVQEYRQQRRVRAHSIKPT